MPRLERENILTAYCADNVAIMASSILPDR